MEINLNCTLHCLSIIFYRWNRDFKELNNSPDPGVIRRHSHCDSVLRGNEQKARTLSLYIVRCASPHANLTVQMRCGDAYCNFSTQVGGTSSEVQGYAQSHNKFKFKRDFVSIASLKSRDLNSNREVTVRHSLLHPHSETPLFLFALTRHWTRKAKTKNQAANEDLLCVALSFLCSPVIRNSHLCSRWQGRSLKPWLYVYGGKRQRPLTVFLSSTIPSRQCHVHMCFCPRYNA